jgi:transcriptional regulator with XRE-family HTH domain
VIYPKDYKKLVQENKDFAALISSGNYIYLGYVVCRLNEKYIDVVFDTDSVEFVLSDFARNHADECCIKFCLKDKNAENYYSQYLHREYLCKEEFSETSEYYYNKKTNGLSSLIEHMIEDEIEKEDKKGVELIHKMEAKGIKEFPEIFTYIMDKASKPRLTKAEVAEVLGCSDKTIQNYRNGQQVPDNIDTVMLICLACKTSPKVSTLLIEKTVGGIPDIGLQKTAYKFLLKYTDTSLKYWNMMLDEFELPHIKQFSEKQQK